jgi:hypothetical protein
VSRDESRVGGAIRFACMYESRVEGACGRHCANESRVGSHNESRVGGACGPPPPFVAPLVPRCALTSGATPRVRAAAPLGGVTAVTLSCFSRSFLSSQPSQPPQPSRSSPPPRPYVSPLSSRSPRVCGRLRVTGPFTADARELAARPDSARPDSARPDSAFGLPSRRRRPSTSRGVAPEVSAQRGTSGATNGGGGPQAPPTRTSFAAHTTEAPPTRLSFRLSFMRANCL